MLGKKKKTTKQKGNWKSIASICSSDKFDGFYLKVRQDADAALLLLDKETGQYYNIKSMSIFEPHKNAPDFVEGSVAINLNNEHQVELLTEDDE